MRSRGSLQQLLNIACSLTAPLDIQKTNCVSPPFITCLAQSLHWIISYWLSVHLYWAPEKNFDRNNLLIWKCHQTHFNDDDPVPLREQYVYCLHLHALLVCGKIKSRRFIKKHKSWASKCGETKHFQACAHSCTKIIPVQSKCKCSYHSAIKISFLHLLIISADSEFTANTWRLYIPVRLHVKQAAACLHHCCAKLNQKGVR